MKKVISAVLSTLMTVTFLFTGCTNKEPEQLETPEILVTAEDIQKYKEMFGNDLDMKKAVLVLFNTLEECADFIEQHGNDENVLDLGIGIIPEMAEDNEGKFYNVTGNAVLEPVFDTLSDGENASEPIEYAGMWCYLKRLKVYNLLDDKQSAEQFIMEINKHQRGND